MHDEEEAVDAHLVPCARDIVAVGRDGRRGEDHAAQAPLGACDAGNLAEEVEPASSLMSASCNRGEEGKEEE